MTNTQPNVDPKGLYGTNEAADALGVHNTTICRWHRQGILKGGHRRCNGHSVFSGEEIIRFWKSMM